MTTVSPGAVFNINSILPTSGTETELGSLHLKQIGELRASTASRLALSRLALSTYHAINIDAAANLFSFETAAERLEGASKFPTLATRETCAVFANTAIKANETAKRDEDKLQAEKIAQHAVGYLVEATKYSSLRDFTLPHVLELFKTKTLSNNVRLGILKDLCQSLVQSRTWSDASWGTLSKGLRDYVVESGDKDEFARLVKASPFLEANYNYGELQAFGLHFQRIMEGKARFPAPAEDFSELRMPSLRGLAEETAGV